MNDMRTTLARALALGAVLAALVPAAHAAPVALENGYVRAGVNDAGTLGSNGNASPGILFDKTGTANYGVNDFLTPGTPFEGFYLSGGGRSWLSNNTGGSSFALGSPTSTGANGARWSGVSFDGAIGITNVYTLTTIAGRSVIDIGTTITNLGGTGLDGLQFLRTLDPDPDLNAFGSYDTTNTLVGANQACATGNASGQTICLFSQTEGFAQRAGISASWSQQPSDYLAGLNDGDGDNAIGLAYELGGLAAGGSVTLHYGYALGASIDVVAAPVPEPESYALMLAGLGMLGAVARAEVREPRSRGPIPPAP